MLKILAECWEIATCFAPTTQPVRLLLAGRGTKPSTRGRQRCPTHDARSRAFSIWTGVTRTVTHGSLRSIGHADCSPSEGSSL